MSPELSGSGLLQAVVRILGESERSLLARDIADRIGGPDLGDVKSQVNRCLYGPLAPFVRRDAQFRWRLVRTPTFAGAAGRASSALEAEVDSPSSSIDPDILRRVQGVFAAWKRDLIEFGRKNKVLYFSSSRRTKLRILVPTSETLYEGLVLREKSYSFPFPAEGSIELAELDEAPGRDNTIRERPGDIVVDYESSSASDVRSLQRKLYRLRTDAHSVLNEQGINTLHLALGLLRWREADAAESWVESPIVLVPVSLLREKNKPYSLSGFEGDVVVNPALSHRMSHDFSISLPSFDPFDGFGEKADLPGYFSEVAAIVSDRGWEVIEDAWLTHLSFEKLVMYEDLSQPGTEEEAAAHSVVGSLIGVAELDIPEVRLEEWAPAFELPEAFPVVEADASQLEVLARARAGQSFVVQGPPGTGKSQTIVNLIAQAIRDGKKVLFVSEKRAALEVVYRRLRGTGLADLCLELHSHKANKREVVEDLYLGMQNSLGSARAAGVAGFDERRRLRERLDNYVTALHEPRGKAARSAYWVQGRLTALQDAPIVNAPLPIESVIDLIPSLEHDLQDATREVFVTGVWDRAPRHAWRDAAFEDPPFVIQQVISPESERLSGALSRIEEVLTKYARLCGDDEPFRFGDLDLLVTRLQFLRLAPDGVPGSWLTIDAAAFGLAKESANAAFEIADRADDAEAALIGDGLENLCAEVTLVARLNELYRTKYASRFRRLGGPYRQDRRTLRSVVGRKLDYRDALAALDLASRFHHLRAATAELEPGLVESLGTAVPESRDERRGVERRLEWAAHVRDSFRSGAVPARCADALSSEPTDVRDMASAVGEELREARGEAQTALDVLATWFPNGIDGSSLREAPVDNLRSRVTEWVENRSQIEEWTAYYKASKRCRELGLGPFLDAARARGVGSSELERALERLLLTNWITELYRQVPELGSFGLRSHEEARLRFAELDEALLVEARQAVLKAANDGQEIVRLVAANLHGRLNDASDRVIRNEYMLIAREHEKRRRHLPLRRLLPKVPHILPAVKPCLLMSPLSVASYLPRASYTFDLVVFDEASQVLPADAVGAILRAKQLIVLGDGKQLPPTRFFQRQLGYEDDGEELDDEAVDTSAFDSILEVCATVLPTTGLRWHYRSRDERLIAFSNRRFYSERPLITFPTANPGGDTGVRFHYVPGGLYDRGGAKVNTVEAQIVADLVVQHFESHGWDRTLGVITLSLSQRDAVELEVRRRALTDSNLEQFLTESGSEPFFVKNLETVQGDERDSIIISLGYGPSEPGGSPQLFFGPVNAAGGERRLNVAVTRAKYEVILVSSMRPEQLDRTSDLRGEGPKVLAEYVRYASRGGRFETVGGAYADAAPDSPFEEAVLEALRSRGYDVDPQVGSSHYRIDLAVRHPDWPTRYLLGIECDGVTYHSSADARERDRLRQEVLEQQGWTIHRIWSTDWLQHPDVALASVIERIESLRKTDQVGTRIGDDASAPFVIDAAQGVTEEPGARLDMPREAQLPVPFIEEARESLVYEKTRLERQLDGIGPRDPSVREPDKGLASEQVRRTLRQRLEQVVSALERIDAGAYGTCASCSGPIETERLEAVPSTPLCRSCSKSAD